MKKVISLILVVLMSVCLLASCGEQPVDEFETPDSTVVVESEEVSSEEQNEQEQIPGYTGVLNPITGLYDLTPSAEGSRYYTMMIGNTNEALPQLGISNADMIYEMLVEGGITRLMAFYADIDKVGDAKIGSCRSARTNFVSTAYGYDALFGHFGGSKSGYEMIKSNKVNDLDGFTNYEPYFWRDAWRKEHMAVEHSALTSGTQLKALAEKKGYRLTRKEPESTAFKFNTDGDVSVNGTTSDATSVSVKFSNYMTCGFEYDAESGVYKKLRKGQPHIDGNNNEQLAFKNVLVIYDHHGYEEDNLHIVVQQKAGEGIYFCDGKAVPITWSKGAVKNPYKFMTADGKDLLVSPGKTYVGVVRLTAEITY